MLDLTWGWQEVVRGLLSHMQSISPRDGTFANLLMRTRDPKTGWQLAMGSVYESVAIICSRVTA